MTFRWLIIFHEKYGLVHQCKSSFFKGAAGIQPVILCGHPTKERGTTYLPVKIFHFQLWIFFSSLSIDLFKAFPKAVQVFNSPLASC